VMSALCQKQTSSWWYGQFLRRTHRDRPPRAHQLEGVNDLLSVRAHVNYAGGFVSKLVLVICRNRIAKHQRINNPDCSRLHCQTPIRYTTLRKSAMHTLAKSYRDSGPSTPRQRAAFAIAPQLGKVCRDPCRRLLTKMELAALVGKCLQPREPLRRLSRQLVYSVRVAKRLYYLGNYPLAPLFFFLQHVCTLPSECERLRDKLIVSVPQPTKVAANGVPSSLAQPLCPNQNSEPD
jgi:hypothetical protein